MLSLEDYRRAVALDEPFVRGTAAPADRLPALVAEVVAHLEGDDTGARFPGDVPLHALPGNPRQRLRALLTVRGPEPLPRGVQAKLDAILSAEREAGPVVAPGSLPTFRLPSGDPRMALSLWRGDITTLAADAIVNAANAELLGCFRPFHACIDNAIHAAAGPRLREDCGRIMRLQGALEPTGTAKATRAYHLPSRFVLHTVGPAARRPLAAAQEQALASCYRSCLDLAIVLPGVRSVAFCGISTGVFGFPREPAARIALSSVAAWLDEHPDALDLVVFDVFGAEDLATYRSVLARGGVTP